MDAGRKRVLLIAGTLLIRASFADDMYTAANNPRGLEEVAADLETLAKKLPD
jgi:hypothetical protein